MLKKESLSIPTPPRTTSGLSCSSERRAIFSKLGYGVSNFKNPLSSLSSKQQVKSSKSESKSVARHTSTSRLTTLSTRSTKKKTVKRKKKRKNKKRTNNGSDGLTREIELSDALQAVVKEQKMSRPAVVKAIWAYAKSENRVDPKDGRVIICDKKLKDIFSDREQVHMFEIQRLLLPHFLYSNESIDKEEVTDEMVNVKKSQKLEENKVVNDLKDTKKHVENNKNIPEGYLERFVMGDNITLDHYPTSAEHTDNKLKNESFIPYLYRQDPSLIEPTHTFMLESISKTTVTLSFTLEISNFLFTHIQHKNIQFIITMDSKKLSSTSLGDSLYFPRIKNDPGKLNTSKDIPIKIEGNNTHRSTHFPYLVRGLIEFHQLQPNLSYDFTLKIARVNYGTPQKSLNLSIIELMPRENINLWSVEAVSLLMNSLKIPSFAKICHEYGINGGSLMKMKTQDFHALGLTVDFLIERIQIAISELN